MFRKALPLSCVSLLLLVACIVPEKFTAEYKIQPNGSYSLIYEGTMVNAFSRLVAWEAKEKKKAQDAKAEKQIQVFRDALKDDPRTKNFKEESTDVYRVRVEESGNLKEKQFLPFFSKGTQVWSLQYDKKANTVTFNIKPMQDKNFSKMEALNISPDGEIKISTDCKIVSSNVNLDKSFFGNTHSFHVKKESLKKGVSIILQLE